MFQAIAVVATLTALLVVPTPVSVLSADIEKQLTSAEYVYIASTRKDGTLGEPAEIWFHYHDGAVYVGTQTTSWRVKRIKWGRPQAKIWVGKRDGLSFGATGELVEDEAMEALLMKRFAAKYPKGWEKYADNFRKGFAGGGHVVVRYTPATS